MRWPWTGATRSNEEWQQADDMVAQVRSHLRVLLHELSETLERVDDKRQRGLPGDG